MRGLPKNSVNGIAFRFYRGTATLGCALGFVTPWAAILSLAFLAYAREDTRIDRLEQVSMNLFR